MPLNVTTGETYSSSSPSCQNRHQSSCFNHLISSERWLCTLDGCAHLLHASFPGHTGIKGCTRAAIAFGARSASILCVRQSCKQPKCKAVSKLWLSAGALWRAECWQLWRESVSQAHLYLGSGSRQHSAGVAQAPAHLPVLSAHHQPARQCAGDHVMQCVCGSVVPAFVHLACSTYASMFALLSLLVELLHTARYPSLFSTSAEEQA